MRFQPGPQNDVFERSVSFQKADEFLLVLNWNADAQECITIPELDRTRNVQSSPRELTPNDRLKDRNSIRCDEDN